MSEFSGIGLAPGVVRGARSFGVDNLGRLTGINYKQVWRPDENVSECRKGESDGGYFGISFTRMMPGYYSDPTPTVTYANTSLGRKARKAVKAALPATTPVVEEERDTSEPEHDMESCNCGFYGYYDGSNDYYSKGRVAGVVEGYGEALIGTRGFRVAKARIVALRIPKHVTPRLAVMVARNYKDIPQFDKFSAMVAAFPTDAGGVACDPDTDPEFWERSV